MEERPFQRGELVKYALIALAVLVVIGVLFVWWQANPSCSNTAGVPPCGNIKNAL